MQPCLQHHCRWSALLAFTTTQARLQVVNAGISGAEGRRGDGGAAAGGKAGGGGSGGPLQETSAHSCTEASPPAALRTNRLIVKETGAGRDACLCLCRPEWALRQWALGGLLPLPQAQHNVLSTSAVAHKGPTACAVLPPCAHQR